MRADLAAKLTATRQRIPVTFCGEAMTLVERPWLQYQKAGEIAAAGGAFDGRLLTVALIALSLEDATGSPVFDASDPADIAALGQASPAEMLPLSAAVLKLYGLSTEAQTAAGKDSATTPSAGGSSPAPAPTDASPGN